MARRGLEALLSSVNRKLMRHEVNRGYLFVSLNKKLPEFLNVNNFVLEIGRFRLLNRRIDVSGRVHVGRKILSSFSVGSDLIIQIHNAGQLIITVK